MKVDVKEAISDFSKLIKFRLTCTVVFSASVSFLMASKVHGNINWWFWMTLIGGGFLVTAAANGFNEIIEKDLDKLMDRTMDRPIPAGRMTSGAALVVSLFMAIVGTLMLFKLNFLTGLLSVFSIVIYAFVYTPLKKKSPIAVFVGAIPGALPPLIGYFAGFHKPFISWIPLILFLIQFMWQFPHFWAIAWVLDDDYKHAGFRLLPTKNRDQLSALFLLVSAVILIPVSMIPFFCHFGGYIYLITAIFCGLFLLWQALMLYQTQSVLVAKRLMYSSLVYLPTVQLVLLFDFITK